MTGEVTIPSTMPRTAALVEEGERGGHAGQLYVSVGAKPIVNTAWGMTPAGAPVTTDTLVVWASAVKPSTCVAWAQQWEAGTVDIDDRVVRFIPDFGVEGKDAVTMRHLLTHTAHLGGYAGPRELGSWDDTVAKIVRAPREPYRRAADRGLPPLGRGAGYNPAGIWILAEVVRRIAGRPFAEYVRREILRAGRHG